MAAGDSTTITSANVEQNPGIQPQKIIIENKQGEKLVGLLHETGSKEIVILCHGVQLTKEYSMMVELALALEKQGISAFRFDFSGNGESEGSYQSGFYKEVDDLQAVIQHFIVSNRILSAILGHSKGGSVVILYASLHRDIKTVVNVSGRYKMDRDMKSKTGEVSLRVMEESLMELKPNMHDAGVRIDKDCRVLTVHGSDDEVNPVEDALEFAKVIPNHELRIIEGANHGYTSHKDELCSAVLAFVMESC